MRTFNIIHSALTVGFLSTALAGCENAKDIPTLDIVTKELCDKRIVLLGENGNHGDGATIAFKTELIQNLVNQCNFNEVYFESGFYDAMAIHLRTNKNEPITPDMVGSAMGWIRNQDQEIAPLIPFLHENIVSGKIKLGGVDDQTGGRGEYYSLKQMVVDLTMSLPESRRDVCTTKLKQRVWYIFLKTDPYTPKKLMEIQKCLSDIRGTLTKFNNAQTDKYLGMLASIERSYARDFKDPKQLYAARDHSMFINFEWLVNHAPTDSKFIIWSTNTHLAKDVSSSPAFANGKNLGGYIHEKYGKDSFSLGFSALSGNYRYTIGQEKPIPLAPKPSLERYVFQNTITNTTFINSADLAKVGNIQGALFAHEYRSFNWSKSFDGIVVFKTERAPKRINNQK